MLMARQIGGDVMRRLALAHGVRLGPLVLLFVQLLEV
jgi:hypothetical protein